VYETPEGGANVPRKLKFLVFAGVVGFWGCVSQAQFLNQYEGAALATAQRRGAFELDCPSVSSAVLSRKVVQPVFVRGVQRAQYTIGVRGCGRQAVYWTMCADADNCNALANTGRVQEEMGQ
jgi:hypothetical protein